MTKRAKIHKSLNNFVTFWTTEKSNPILKTASTSSSDGANNFLIPWRTKNFTPRKKFLLPEKFFLLPVATTCRHYLEPQPGATTWSHQLVLLPEKQFSTTWLKELKLTNCSKTLWCLGYKKIKPHFETCIKTKIRWYYKQNQTPWRKNNRLVIRWLNKT